MALGTDAENVSNHTDICRAMQLAALLPRDSTRDPNAISAEQALEMATLGGATTPSHTTSRPGPPRVLTRRGPGRPSGGPAHEPTSRQSHQHHIPAHKRETPGSGESFVHHRPLKSPGSPNSPS
jgi:hypothetical protein